MALASSHQVKRARQPLYPDSRSLQPPNAAQGNSAYPVNMCWSQESRKAISVWSTWTLLRYYQTQVAKTHTCTFLPVFRIESGHHPFWLHPTTPKLRDTLTSHDTFRALAERCVIGNPSALPLQYHPPRPHQIHLTRRQWIFHVWFLWQGFLSHFSFS